MVALTVDGYFFSNFVGWRLNFRAFDGWRLISENLVQELKNFRESVFDNMALGFSSGEILQEPKVREDELK